MKKLVLFVFLGAFLAGCFSDNETTSVGAEQKVAKTCLDAGDQKLPKGTVAERVSDGAKVALDASGCFSFEGVTAKVAGRVAADDSVIFYNDSALFALTIPYFNGSDTIPVVPTIVVLQDAPNAEVDSVDLIVFDKVNFLSRTVQLRRADYGDSSSFSRTLWSVDNGARVYVHFQINGKKVFASSVYTVYPGSVAFRNWNQVKQGAVPNMYHGVGSFNTPGRVMYTNFTSKCDTVVNDSVTGIKIRAWSIYGVASIKIDGVVSDSINVIDSVGLFKHYVTITDSAGYVSNDSLSYFNHKSGVMYGLVSDTLWNSFMINGVRGVNIPAKLNL